MSTAAIPGDASSAGQGDSAEQRINATVWSGVQILASLKLTCVLLLLGMFVVLVGSLAQARRDVWLVVDQYFRTYLAWIDVADFFPPSMFPGFVNTNWDSLGKLRYIPFPGGWTIGWIMLANLLSAHLLRFKVRAIGGRLLAGIATIAVGALLTGIVVWTGNQQTGVEYGDTVLSPMNIWYLMLGVLGIGAVVPMAVAFTKSTISKPERVLLGVIGLTLGAVLAYFVIGGESARLNLSSMRILWQLLKGTACAVVILIGSNLLFDKRGGVVVLHIGVALLMFSELQVGFYAKENLLSLQEGQTLSFMRDVRQRELAITHRVDGRDHVVAIPESRLLSAAESGTLIEHDGLPFKVRVDEFLRNSQLRPVMPGEEKSATTGLGTFATAVEIDPVTGMDDSHDMSAVRITLLDKNSDKELNTMLCAQDVAEMRSVPIAEQATVDGKDFQLYLRFERSYKDYEVELLDVSRTNYVGSATPRDYRSKILITDQESGDAQEYTLWMNNPLRYKGETFYQSGYNQLPNGTEMTTLSVVRNTGWMLPYIACMIVAVGMFAQFGQTLARYLSRLDRSGSATPVSEPSSEASASLPEGIRAAAGSDPTVAETDEQSGKSVWPVLVPVILVVLSVAWLGSKARPPKADPQAMNLYGFAQLPVAWKGRAQPVDSFARTELLMASHKSTFKGELSQGELDHEVVREKLMQRIRKVWPTIDADELNDFSGEYNDWIEKLMSLTSSGREAVEEGVRDIMTARMPAVRWFLDSVAKPSLARRHRVIKIDDDQVLALLSLEKRPGLTYSLEEIQKNLSELEPLNREGLKLQMENQEHRMSQAQRRVVALFQTVSRIDSLQNIFLVRESEGLMDSLVKSWWVLDRLGNSPAIMAVPTGSENEQRSWETLIAANSVHNLKRELKQAGLSSSKDVLAYVINDLPGKIVSRDAIAQSVEGSLNILKSALKGEGDSPEPSGDQIKERALAGAAQINEPYLSQVLTLIGNAAPGASVDEIVSGITDDELRKLGMERISADTFQIFEALQQKSGDQRLTEIRTRLMAVGTDNPDQLTEVMNQELVKLALDDLNERVGSLLYEESDVFDTATSAIVTSLQAWRDGDVAEFNKTVSDYRQFLATQSLPHVDASVVSLEAFFNLFEPFMKAIYLYLPVLLMSFLSWIVYPTILRRSGLWLMMLAFVVHTIALLMRMYISGRPPVTNLYSSAIFIGWAVVGAAFFIEALLKNGIGNILGASVGMGTLVIAHYLARDEGDTLGVMQAVLDTTFWLATHVVCITLGYAATFLAGAMAIAYCVMTLFGSGKSRDLGQLGKMIYGVLCFALFFSLVGTVLGGLWADDSWGRFWGWDPKENGAMLIVMWNAVILHARWDRMVRDYGTAVLAIFGNIVTAWSWFGVNELKAGLHTYGFTEGRLLWLGAFIAINALLMAAALLLVPSKDSSKAFPAT